MLCVIFIVAYNSPCGGSDDLLLGKMHFLFEIQEKIATCFDFYGVWLKDFTKTKSVPYLLYVKTASFSVQYEYSALKCVGKSCHLNALTHVNEISLIYSAEISPIKWRLYLSLHDHRSCWS